MRITTNSADAIRRCNDSRRMKGARVAAEFAREETGAYQYSQILAAQSHGQARLSQASGSGSQYSRIASGNALRTSTGDGFRRWQNPAAITGYVLFNRREMSG